MWLFDVPMHHKVFTGRPKWADNYWTHTRVMRLFGDLEGINDVRKRSDILYRVEPGIGFGRVLVQANTLINDPEIRRADLGKMLANLVPGQHVGLKVKANAVRTVNKTINNVVKTSREGLGIDNIEKWFFDSTRESLEDIKLYNIEFGIERQRSFPISVVTIDATATVADTQTLINVITEGIGRAKAFGCGLISVRLVK